MCAVCTVHRYFSNLVQKLCKQLPIYFFFIFSSSRQNTRNEAVYDFKDTVDDPVWLDKRWTTVPYSIPISTMREKKKKNEVMEITYKNTKYHFISFHVNISTYISTVCVPTSNVDIYVQLNGASNLNLNKIQTHIMVYTMYFEWMKNVLLI